MADRKHSRGISRFTLTWILIIVCIALIWSVCMVFLSSLLEEYEAVQPKYAAEKVFEKYFLTADSDSILNYNVYPLNSLEDRQNAVDYVSSILNSGELRYKEVFSGEDSKNMYAVSAGDVTFASFTLTSGNDTTEILGLAYPALADITVNLKPLYGTVIYAPLSATVRVNGNVLDESYIEGKRVTLDEAVYFPAEDENGRVMVNYSVSGLFAEPTVSVTYEINSSSSLYVEEMGAPAVNVLELVDEEGVYSAEYSYLTLLAGHYNEKVRIAEEKRIAEEERLRREEEERLRLIEEQRQRISDSIKVLYENFVLQMAEQYNDFIYYRTTTSQQDKTKVYFKPGTDIYGYVTKGASGGYYNWSDYRVTKMSFVDEQTSYYEWLDDNHTTFKCRISMTVAMYGYNTETGKYYDDNEAFAMTAYVDISNPDEPKVYKLVTTESDLEEAAKKG